LYLEKSQNDKYFETEGVLILFCKQAAFTAEARIRDDANAMRCRANKFWLIELATDTMRCTHNVDVMISPKWPNNACHYVTLLGWIGRGYRLLKK
jgi:hypothetical protein